MKVNVKAGNEQDTQGKSVTIPETIIVSSITSCTKVGPVLVNYPLITYDIWPY